MNNQKELAGLYEKLEVKYDALKESHDNLLTVLSITMKKIGCREMPLLDKLLTEAKKLQS